MLYVNFLMAQITYYPDSQSHGYISNLPFWMLGFLRAGGSHVALFSVSLQWVVDRQVDGLMDSLQGHLYLQTDPWSPKEDSLARNELLMAELQQP